MLRSTAFFDEILSVGLKDLIILYSEDKRKVDLKDIKDLKSVRR